ncbi:Na(+)-translocating NADH-quinone reductase subunit F [Sporomusa silvacetica DSM 10669]|uniref:Na(+)-translocating NADH-quinone reductase subunit F n=1 Tax=Sporomusa silvacetica DSM 10669 TaxID=1123289 RepID=A0ABZ3IRH7_9FIRM|nr:ASKHA domain-containing protein [Sporomusa silvacetica]OZC20767.1 Na(+)-translocating NADH-quinone reductase subunit F [Sporomusa silvacetica DSM 10669]
MSGLKLNNGLKVIIDYQPVGKRVQTDIGQTVLAAAHGIELFEHNINAPCGGKGLCLRCLIRLIDGQLSLPSAVEIQNLTKEQLDQNYRLACQARVFSSSKVEIPASSLVGRQQLKIDGCVSHFETDYPYKQYVINGLRKPDLDYPYSLWQQVDSLLAGKYGVTDLTAGIDVLRHVKLTENEGHAVVAVYGNEIVDISPPAVAYRPLGLAIDLGTTKIAIFLVELDTGVVLASAGMLNPQIAYGEDLMSRLAFALDTEDNARRMAVLAADGINQLVKRLTFEQGRQVTEISQAVIVANSAMHHLLLGLPLNHLALSPYVPVTMAPITVTAQTIGLHLQSEAKVYMMGLVGGFVGSDHVAMIQASGIDEAQTMVLGIDIGTNTEIAVAGRDGRVSSCSCASGPAFEGAHIYQGMRAVDGAISQVNLINCGMKAEYQTIGGYKPIGLCGSGIIDLIAELNKNGIISVNGRLDLAHPRVRNGPGMVPEFLIAAQAESGCDTDIVITQNDIVEIQLAKAAIAAGIKRLMAISGITVQDVDKVIIAGAFGSFLKIQSAIAIGMLPELPLERFVQVGNAAGVGACMNLVSMRERQRNEALAKKIAHIELAVSPEFKRDFAKALKFPKLGQGTDSTYISANPVL